MKNLTENLGFTSLFLLFFTNLSFGQDHHNHDSLKITYRICDAVEEKSEITFYLPQQVSYIGQYWDTSHEVFRLRTRQNLIVEKEKEIGLGYLSVDFGIKKSPIYLSLQGRFGETTEIWVGANSFLTNNKFVNKAFYQAQIGAYKNIYEQGTLFTGYFQTQLIFHRFFFEGFYNYYPETKHEKSRKDFEIELGFKLTHILALIGGFEIIENKKTLQVGISIEMYKHKHKSTKP